MNMTTQTIINIIEIIVGIGVFSVAFGYVSSQFKRGRDESSHASNESNNILRGLIDDQKQELLRQRERQHDMLNEVQVIKLQMQHIQDKRDYLERLVMVALQQYFATDPAIADAVNTSISKEKSKGILPDINIVRTTEVSEKRETKTVI